MKIRIFGTKEELVCAKKYYMSLENMDYVKSVSVSKAYANRGSNTVFRMYIDIEYKDNYIYSQKELE